MPERMDILATCLMIGLLAAPPGAAAQGARPLDDAAYADAIAQGRTGESPGNDPFVMRLGAQRDALTLDVIEDAPFTFFIETPYSAVSGQAALAATASGPVRVFTKDEANARLVTIEVAPGRIADTADGIFHVVLRRGRTEIRPVRARLMPERVEDDRGAQQVMTAGSFTFPFHAFEPSEPLTIVFVGRRRSFEWTIRPEELRALR